MTPSTGTPSTGTPSTGTPSTGTPGTGDDADLTASRQPREPSDVTVQQGLHDDGAGESVLRSQERMRVGVSTEETGRIRVLKHIDTDTFSQSVPRDVERADVEREPAGQGDSGQVETLADGSLSVPVFEEQLVVEKRLVVRERIIVRKVKLVEQQEVSAQLRSERVEVLAEGDVRVADDSAPLT